MNSQHHGATPPRDGLDRIFRKIAELLTAVYDPIRQHYPPNDSLSYVATFTQVRQTIMDLALSMTTPFAYSVNRGTEDAVCQLASLFGSDLNHRLTSIDVDAARNEAEKVSARRAFYGEVISNIAGPLASICEADPSISETYRCIRRTLTMILRICLILREWELDAYLSAGGRRPRRASF
ncbi:hypothetical protein VTK26DRAFT_2426 [Humicola hyalothermophila]